MNGGMSFPIHHISVRVPWHDSGWNGAVCADPKNNSACIKLTRIAQNKNDALESAAAGKFFGDMDGESVPPCLQENGAFMSERGLRGLSHRFPWQGGTKQTEVNYLPYSAAAIPFRWMLKKSFYGQEGAPPLRDNYPLDGIDERLEPTLGFEPVWWQDHRNHRALLDTFWGHVREDVSLVFFYAKQIPLAENAPGGRVLVGVGRVKRVGPIREYSPDGKNRSVLWERMVHHSIRPRFDDGFLMPYQEALEKSRDGDAFDPAETVAFAPEDRFEEFSYSAEHVSDDAAIEALMSMRAALGKSRELFGADVDTQEGWIDAQLGRLWRKRGAFPGMGAVLSATGLPMGNFIARALSEGAGDSESPWNLWFALLDNPAAHLHPELARRVDSTIAASWKRMPAERRAFLELLSRVDLTQWQAGVLAVPEARRNLGIARGDSEFTNNPYLLYEDTRLTETPVSISAVDRGLLPASSVRTKFPVPAPSRVDTPVDARRLRALSIYELEKAAEQGDTLMPRDAVVANLRERDSADDDSQSTPVTADLLGVAEDALFNGEIRLVEMSDGKPAYQLERLGKAGDLIRKTVQRRLRGRRHNIQADWRRMLDDKLGEHDPQSELDAELEERARTEKAEALAEIANARISVLIGSAGTGKTTLLSVLSEHPEIRKGGVRLLAPTGKARVRMEAAMGGDDPAYTIAQHLITSGRFKRFDRVMYRLTGEPGEMRGRTVIVDECSMLTEEMLAALLESLKGMHRLILVGDPRQLPPIGAGRPFMDIIERIKRDNAADKFPKVARSYAELTVQRRQGTNDQDAIELAEWFGGEPGPNHDSAFGILSGQRESETVKVVRWETSDDLQNLIPQILAEHLGFRENADETLEFSRSLGGVIAGKYDYFNVRESGQHAEDWQILSPHRWKAWGVDTLNRIIHQRYKSRQVASAASGGRFLKPQGDQQIVYGDKVINNRNMRLPNSRKWPQEEGFLANGEIGIVVGQIRTGRFPYSPWEMEVEFSTQANSVVKFRPSDFSDERDADLELAYALTIHKAQGSEFRTVFLILPKSGHMLSRELIYTALTRQTDKIVVLMQGAPADIHRLSSPEHSETAGRLTNLFAPPKPVRVGDRFLEDGLIHQTARGEAVRSKSEVVIANLLHAVGADYAYEQPLEIAGTVKYPDFTIEDDDAGEVYYWEHLGMLSNVGYRRRWETKKDWFRRHGILPVEEGGGSNGTLITTRDSDNGGIDSEEVARIVGDLFGSG